MSDKKNADHTDRLSPEELFDRFSDDSFSSLLADDSVWGQNLPSDFSFNEGEGSDDAWGRERIGDSADPFGLADISSGFGHPSSETEEIHTAEEAGKLAAEADSRMRVSDLCPSQSGDTNSADVNSLIRDFLHKDILSEEFVGGPEEEITAEDTAVSEDQDISMAEVTAADELISAGVDATQPAARLEGESAPSRETVSSDRRVSEEKDAFITADPGNRESGDSTGVEGGRVRQPKKKLNIRPIHVVCVWFVLFALLARALSSIPERKTEDREEEVMTLFSEASISAERRDYYAVIDVSDIEGLWLSYQDEKDWVLFVFGDQEHYQEYGTDLEDIYFFVSSGYSIKNESDFDEEAQEIVVTPPYYPEVEDLEIAEKDRRHFSWDICDVYYLAYGPTGKLPGPEADFMNYYFWIQAPDRSEFQLTLTCGFSRMDQAFDPKAFLDDHIRIEKY